MGELANAPGTGRDWSRCGQRVGENRFLEVHLADAGADEFAALLTKSLQALRGVIEADVLPGIAGRGPELASVTSLMASTPRWRDRRDCFGYQASLSGNEALERLERIGGALMADG